MTRKSLSLVGVAGCLGLIGLILAGCSSEPAKVKVDFRVVTEKGEAMEEIQVTFLSKDNKNAEMSQSVGGGLGSVMLFPNTYGVGVSKYEGGRSAQSLQPGSKEFEDAKASGTGNIPPSNVLPPLLEDPFKSGLEMTVKPGMARFDIVVKGVNEFKNPEPKKAMVITKDKDGAGKGFGGGKGKGGEKGPNGEGNAPAGSDSKGK